MSQAHLSQQTVQFAFFDAVLGRPDWRGASVLDFGGNVGNILRDPGSTLEPERYWCIDVIAEALEVGRRSFPRAHWIFYNRYNREFNPGGIPGLPIPPTSIPFDLILAYSVFSHTDRDEMITLVDELRERLSPGGVLAFSFIDPHYDPSVSCGEPHPGWSRGSNLRWRLEKLRASNPRLDVEAALDRARRATRCTLVDDGDLFVDDEADRAQAPHRNRRYLTFFSPRYVGALFPDSVILPPPVEAYRPPAPAAEFHHCCLLKRIITLGSPPLS
jgi:SAM-dependent methyltransferase